MTIQKRAFGNTGMEVSVLGYGGGQIGSPSISDTDAEQLLNAVLDNGVNLIDTARGYGRSEERIGKYLSHRRSEFVLSTKVGYDIPGFVNWSYDIILAGIEEALRVLNTEMIDIVHLHSCSVDTLERGEVIQALEDARKSGKIRAAAYSGENEPLAFAIDSGRFQVIQTSINICDQRVLDRKLPTTLRRGVGVIAKRPVANAPWRFDKRPTANYAEEYWLRWKAMQINPHGLPWQELALRFAAFTPGVHSCIVATTNIEHLKENIKYIENGPLPDQIIVAIRSSFKEHDRNWIGQI
jgi:aryl-alcohol dehydrogenase-like predicted oxidoreductase